MVRSRFHGLIEPDWRSFFVVVPVEPSPEEIPEAEEYGIVDTITPATTASTTIEVQWRPIQMRIFHSNESCQLAPILSLLPLFFGERKGA